MKMIIHSKAAFKFNVISITITTTFLRYRRGEKSILKFIWNLKRLEVSKVTCTLPATKDDDRGDSVGRGGKEVGVITFWVSINMTELYKYKQYDTVSETDMQINGTK